MQQAMPNNQARQSKTRLQAVRNHLKLAGTLTGEMLALASLISALATGFLLLVMALQSAA